MNDFRIYCIKQSTKVLFSLLLFLFCSYLFAGCGGSKTKKLVISEDVDCSSVEEVEEQNLVCNDESSIELCKVAASAIIDEDRKLEIIDGLLKNGADINYQNLLSRDCDTPLQMAINQQEWRVAKLLIERGADLILGSWREEGVPLHSLAVYCDDEIKDNVLEVAEIMISKDRRCLECQSLEFRTPLHLAVFSGFFEIADLFVRYGANVDVKDSFDKSPLDYALSYASEAEENDGFVQEYSRRMIEILRIKSRKK